MDKRLYDSVVEGDVPTILSLVREAEDVINQVDSPSGNTVLHLAARFGHLELVSLIVNLRPELVFLENENLETPLHEASREGRLEILKLLLQVDSSGFQKLNRNGESVLFVACEMGKLDVVKFLLRELMVKSDDLTASLHAASSRGDTDVVKEIVKVRPDLAQKKDSQGCTPLHLACSKGHLEITRELLRLDPYLALLQDNDGQTPLQRAEMKGHVNIVDEFLYVSHQSAEMKMNHGGSVLHMGVKNDQFEAVKCFAKARNVSQLCMCEGHQEELVKQPSELHDLRDARNTIMVVAVLIACVTFSAGTAFPSGFNPTSERTRLKVSMLCNGLAMFLSLAAIITLFGVIPFRGESKTKLLAVAHKLLWTALAFMIAAYMAALWTILEGPSANWVWATGGVGITMCMLIGFRVPLIQHWLRKWG